MDKRQQLASNIANATVVVHNQFTRLMTLDKKFALMEDNFREQIAANMKLGNDARVGILATELTNISRIRRTTQHLSMALEALVIRFTTINDFAVILDTINPTIDMIKDIQLQLSKVMPAANEVLSEVTSVTSDVLISSKITADVNRILPQTDSDAYSLLEEIEGVLEEEAKSKLPEIPNTIAQIARQEEQAVATEVNQVMIEG